MTGGFSVYPADLQVHANALDRQAERIGTAGSAAEEAGLGVGTFGTIGQFFATGAHVQAGTARQCIEQLRDSVRRLADGVRDTAELYDSADAANCAIIGEVGGE